MSGFPSIQGMNAAISQEVTRIDIKTIAKVLGVSRQAAANRANRESWPYEEMPGRGGSKFLYPLSDLPRAISRRVLSQRAIAAMKANCEAAKKDMPETFLVVLGGEAFEVRKMPS